MDANELILEGKGGYCPLAFQLDTPKKGRNHDGSFNTLMTTCGLIDPLLLRHSQESPPPTFDAIFLSDHQACYLDLDAKLLFKEAAHNIQPMSRCSLQLQDPRIVDNYYKHLKKQLDYHKLQSKIDELHKAATDTGPRHGLESSFEKIDLLLTEAMLYAELKSRKQFSTKYQWSPRLKEAVITVRYWQMHVQESKGKITSLESKLNLASLANIPVIDTNQLPLAEIVQRLRDARAQLQILQSQHYELREDHLNQLAKARDLGENPSLLSNIDKLGKATAKEIRRIQRLERCKRNHRIVRQILRLVTLQTGLSRVDISDSTDQTVNPKTWEGSWRTLTNPDDIGKVVCMADPSQYNQACVTPFGAEPLLSYFGTNSNTPGADQLLAGEELPLEMTHPLLPETVAILETIQTLPQYSKVLVEEVIITDTVKALYGTLPEKTSLSPLQRHIGHDKAIARRFPNRSDC
jgi:hypothetical protein